MPRKTKHLKDKHCQTKVVMIRGAYQAFIGGTPLHLWWLMGCYTNLAEPMISIHRDLEGISVYKPNCSVLRHQKVPMIHITNYMTRFMNNCKSARRVHGSMNQKTPIRLRKRLHSKFRAIKLEKRSISLQLMHDKAHKLPGRGMNRIHRPSSKL